MSIWNQGVFDATFSNNSTPTGCSQEPNEKLSQLILILTGVYRNQSGTLAVRRFVLSYPTISVSSS